MTTKNINNKTKFQQHSDYIQDTPFNNDFKFNNLSLLPKNTG